MLVQLYNTTTDTTTTVSSDDYVVVGEGLDSGTRTVTYAGASAYDDTYYLILSSNVAYTQPTDYEEGDDFAQETHELALDRLAIQIRQLKEAVDRSVKVAKNLTNPTELSSLSSGYLYTDGTDWSLGEITVTETEYEGSIEKGADASKSATPSAGDIYVATDTDLVYVCFDGSNWENISKIIKLTSGGTFTIKDSSGNVIVTVTEAGVITTTDIDLSGDITVSGTVDIGGTFKVGGSAFLLDEDAMTSNSATQAPSQQSVKAYVSVVQKVYSQTGATATGSTLVPFDDTKPQITEGDQYLSLAITPLSATNKLAIDVNVMLAASVGVGVCIALFQDTTADAVAASAAYIGTDAAPSNFTLRHTMVSGTTSETTFKVRIGPTSEATLTMNGVGGTTRRYGAIAASSITITEFVD
jgi:hypothetical protein